MERRCPVSRYEQLMAAGGPQMLATSSVWCVDAAVRHVLWCFVLQRSLDRCTQLVLHWLRNVQSVQLVVQEIAESAIVLTTHSVLAGACLDVPVRMSLQ